jgi:enterochelin esterase family protein
MKTTLVLVALGTRYWGQAVHECQPSVLNIPDAKYPCVCPDNRAMFRMVAPDAQKVTVRVGRVTFFGSGWQNSGIEIPEAVEIDHYHAKDVPHGHVGQQWYSPTSQPSGGAVLSTRLGVTGLTSKRAGWGEDETGWYTQGHVDFIMDNLIVAGKAKPMIIVTDNLNAAKPGERAVIFAARGPVPAPGATTRGGAFADPAAFSKKVRVLGT